MKPKQDNLFRTSLIALIALYAIIGNAAQISGSLGLPQFDFGFINTTPDIEEARYQLKFLTINNEALSQPTYFADAYEWVESAKSSVAHSLINQIGMALYEGDSSRAERLRFELEDDYFGGFDSAEYEVVFRVFNPVERYTLETNVAEQLMKTFEYARSTLAYNP